MKNNCYCKEKLIIGRTVGVEFLEFETHDVITAKVDTGAYTGGLHAEDIKEENGVLSFRPLSKEHSVVHVHEYRKKWVKPTTGIKTTRYVITTPVKIGDIETTFELTLADRSEMKYDMLVGRKNLSGRFLVDVSI